MHTADSKYHALLVLNRTAREQGSAAEPFFEELIQRDLNENFEMAIRVAVRDGDPIGRILAKVFERTSSPWLSWLAMELCDRRESRHAVALRELALVVTLQVLSVSSALGNQEDEQPRALIARLQRQVALRFADVGKLREAVATASAAATDFQSLFRDFGNTHVYELIAGLTNLGFILREYGELIAAGEPTAEAIKLLESIPEPTTTEEQIIHKEAFSRCFDNSALHALDAGNIQQSIEDSQRAIDYLEELVAIDAKTYRGELARSLYNRAALLRHVGALQEAREVAEQAVEKLSILAQQSPGIYREDLANGYQTLGTILSDLGEVEDAWRATRTTTRIYHGLATQRPDVFLADFAESLDNLALLADDVESTEASIEKAREAVEMIGHWTAGSAAEKSTLALCLHNLGALLAESGALQDALEVTLEAVELRRQLDPAHVATQQEDLAVSLNNLGGIYRDLERPQDALPHTLEAVDIYRGLANSGVHSHQEGLARSLMNQSLQLEDVGDPAAAIEVGRQALRIRRELSEHHASRTPALFRCLYHLATLAHDAERWPEAHRWATQGIELAGTSSGSEELETLARIREDSAGRKGRPE